MPDSTSSPAPRDAGNWARPVDKLSTANVQAGGLQINVAGKHLTGPIRGFGQMWQKTYWVRFNGSTAAPAEIVKVWKAEFPNFWPKGNRFYGPLTGIKPGEVAVLNLAGPGGVTAPGDTPMIATGIMVIYADDTSFSFMTPEGHILAGLITFSAFEEDGATVAQVQALIRTMDPLYELTFRLGVGHKTEDDFWQATLRSLAARFGVDGQPQLRAALVDPRVQWSEAKNIWHNAAIRTGLYLPVELAKKLLGRA
ncbi:MAG: hypothetical protein KA764_22165 [Anaerolineales bacterium]|nr:hypothetical protein [Anaerolineales bacterium]